MSRDYVELPKPAKKSVKAQAGHKTPHFSNQVYEGGTHTAPAEKESQAGNVPVINKGYAGKHDRAVASGEESEFGME